MRDFPDPDRHAPRRLHARHRPARPARTLALAHRVAARSALGIVGEVARGGGEREAIGVRFDQQLGGIPRLDLTAGVMRVETHQRGVTRRRWANGTFVDASVHASELFVVQARLEQVPGDGGLVKPANATFVGMRVEGGGAVKTTIVAAVLMTVLLIYAVGTDKS